VTTDVDVRTDFYTAVTDRHHEATLLSFTDVCTLARSEWTGGSDLTDLHHYCPSDCSTCE
jgi:hypothetical protein